MAGTSTHGAHSMWYDYYKGAVYPLQLEAPPCCKPQRNTTPSLIEVCCTYIVRDAELTRNAIDVVPSILSIHMMEAALKGNHDRSIEALMARWMLKSLVLSKLVPSVFSSLLPLYEPIYQSALVRQGLRYTTSLAHTFLQCLRQDSPTKIRHLDLCGFPTDEVILHYLTSHCMLVHSESRRNNMITLYNHALHMVKECDEAPLNQDKALEINMDNSLPQHISIEIKLDAFVTSEACHSELCKALTVSSFPEARFRLIVEKLGVTCLGGDRVNLLLKQIRQENLKGLQLKYNSLKNRDFLLIAPTLQSLTNLTSLDLSCNQISLVENESMAVIMKQAFSTLKSLERLDLGNNRLKDKLCTALLGISHPLKHLSLTACGLTTLDIAALAKCPFIKNLEELNLSQNNLTPCHFPMCTLLSTIATSIKVLELEDCRISDEVINVLSRHFSNHTRLMYLNMADNSWFSSSVINLAERVCCLGQLQVLRLCYPKDCYIQDIGYAGEEDEMKEQFKATMISLLEAEDNVGQCRNISKLILVNLVRIMP